MRSRFSKSLGIVFAASLLVGILWGTHVSAQVVTADVVGTVTDSSGAVVPNAKVTITNAGTGETRTATSDTAGQYTINQLQPGTYSIKVETLGFKTFQVPSIALSAGNRVREDAQLQIGQQTQTVEVTSTPAALQTDTSSLATTIPNQTVQDLPLNGRNFIQLVLTTPGVSASLPNSILAGTRPDDRRQSSAISANGQPENRNNNMIDGMDNNEIEQGLILIRPSIDQIQEISVKTNDYTADEGGTSGAAVNIITKSGTNRFHGTVYEFLRNNVLDANEYFNKQAGNKRPEFRQNQFGGSLGGPIQKNKTFFFGDYEGLRIVQGASSGLVTVPTKFERDNPGNLSDYCTGDPSTWPPGCDQSTGTFIIPQGQLDNVGLDYFNLFPLPNTGAAGALTNNYVNSPTNTYVSNTYDARVDHHFGQNDTAFVRYTDNPVTVFTAGWLPKINGIQPGGGSFPGTNFTTSRGVQIHYLHTFSPAMIMELGAGYSRLNIDSTALNSGTNAATKFGIPNVNISSSTTGLPPVTITGFNSGLGDSQYLPIVDINNVFQYVGSVNYTHGKHNLKFGGSYIRRQLNYFQNSMGEGTFAFAGNGGPSTALANMLKGNPLSIVRNMPNGQGLGLRTTWPAVYVMDDWRATQNLTINAGLRWELFTPFTESNYKRSYFDLKTFTMILASPGNPTAGVPTDWTTFSPRLGFALNIRHGLVLRGGAALAYYGTLGPGGANNSNPPNTFNFTCQPSSTGALACPAGIGTFSEGLPLPTFGPQSLNPLRGSITARGAAYLQPYIEQFNLTLQKQIGQNVITASYVGELGRREPLTVNINRPLPNPGPVQPFVYAQQLPKVSTLNDNINMGGSSYNAGLLVFERRFSKGLILNANYAWARMLNIAQDSGGNSGPTGLITDNPGYDWGNSDIDVRNRLSVTGVYMLPFGAGLTGIKKQVIAGWEVNGLGYIQTGLPFTVSSSADTPALINLPGVNSDRPNGVPGQPLRAPHRTLKLWINPLAYTPQLQGTAGDARRNQIYGPIQRQLDFAIAKNFPIREDMQLQFRAESFNLTNTPNFAAPNATIHAWTTPATSTNPQPSGTVNANAGAFGSISNTTLGTQPRELQFALKLSF